LDLSEAIDCDIHPALPMPPPYKTRTATTCMLLLPR
jgi:hypothetical protein